MYACMYACVYAGTRAECVQVCNVLCCVSVQALEASEAGVGRVMAAGGGESSSISKYGG